MKKFVSFLSVLLLCAGLFVVAGAAAADPHAPVVTFMPRARHDIRADWEFCLEIRAKSPDKDGVITYQWYQATRRGKNGELAYSAMPGETGSKYIKYARLDKLNVQEASTWYICKVTNTWKEDGTTKSVSVLTRDLQVHAFLCYVDSFKYWRANPAERSLPQSLSVPLRGFTAMARQALGL